ncbi:MAG: hypothetical protein BGO41_03940 [Clostridiales bacterium 38-18]|nr:MAG: hypothetical protein BGO41_03940 [Clostridiales bacterium 38-18]
MSELNFPSVEVIENILSEIIDEIPEPFFEGLNGGIILVESPKPHPQSQAQLPLYIMGEYVSNALGKQIKIYYGSFKKVHPDASLESLKALLKHTLIHEFTHHLEYRAGLRDLEIQDAKDLQHYKSKLKG